MTEIERRLAADSPALDHDLREFMWSDADPARLRRVARAVGRALAVAFVTSGGFLYGMVAVMHARDGMVALATLRTA